MRLENGLKVIKIKIMETLELIRERLESHYEGIYRKIWVQGSARHGQNDVLLTLFPSNNDGYRIMLFRRLSEISFDEIFTILQRELSITNILE